MLRKSLSIVVLSLASVIPTVASANVAASRPPCIILNHQVQTVEPYKVDVRAGKQTYRQLRGATVRVQAAPGLTAEWLRLELGRHITEMAAAGNSSMPNCSLDVKDVQVHVDSTGTGFAVKLIARDKNQGEEVLRRAQLLVG